MLILVFELMGWAIEGKGKKNVRIYFLQQNLLEITTAYSAFYRSNDRVTNGITFLRSQLPVGTVAVPLPMPVDKKKKKKAFDEESSSSSSDEEIPDQEVEVVDEARDAIGSVLLV